MANRRDPKVAIVGAGAMGSVFGGLLTEGGLDVTLVDVWPEHVAAIRERGLKLVGHGGERSIPVKITEDAGSLSDIDVVFFQIKATANRSAARSVLHLFNNPDTIGISFQNGLGSEQEIGEVIGANRMLAGLTAQAALLEAPGVVRNHADLPSYIGELQAGISERVDWLAGAFTQHGLQTVASPNIMLDKWRKLLVNIAFAATSGLTGLTLGGVLSMPDLRDTCVRAMNEAAEVAAAVGVHLDPAGRFDVFDKITKDGGASMNKSSMYADIRARRRSEVDYIYGTAIKLADEHGIAVPTLKTLAAIVRAIEQQYP